MREMPDASIDSVVTDPPYGLRFMGKKWDYDVPGVEVWQEVFRVLKDGGRLLSFGGSRTMHRMWCAIEDAGFTIEDTVMWIYGSGFPKHASKLKPAFEPVVVARQGKVSELESDACRVPAEPGDIGDRIDKPGSRARARRGAWPAAEDGSMQKPRNYTEPDGRWAANVVLDEEAARVMDEQSGTLHSGSVPVAGLIRNSAKTRNAYGSFA